MNDITLKDAQTVLAHLKDAVALNQHYIFIRKSYIDRIDMAIESLESRITRGDFNEVQS